MLASINLQHLSSTLSFLVFLFNASHLHTHSTLLIQSLKLFTCLSVSRHTLPSDPSLSHMLAFHCIPISLKPPRHTPSTPLLSFSTDWWLWGTEDFASTDYKDLKTDLLISQVCAFIHPTVNEGMTSLRKMEGETRERGRDKIRYGLEGEAGGQEQAKSFRSSVGAFLLLRGFPPGSNLGSAW